MRLPIVVCDWLMRTVVPKSFDTPYKHINDYMFRYHCIPIKAKIGDGCGPVSWRRPFAKLLQCFNLSARVHHILRSDDDRAFHDHPWTYLTLVLRGGYTEHKPMFDKSGICIGNSTEWIGPGRLVMRQADSWHRLELPSGQTAWTLFMTGKYRQRWGFMVNPRWKVPYTEYAQQITKENQHGTLHLDQRP